MRTFFSYFGLILLGLGLMLLGADMITTLEHQGQFTLRSYLDIWSLFDKDAAAGFVAWLSKTTPSFVSVPVLAVLSLWAWWIGVIGIVMAFLAGHKKDDGK
jgi:hypothetical protein